MRAFLLLAALLMVAGPAFAQTWDETADGGGDAGELPGTAQAVGSGPYTAITGVIEVGNSDVDMYEIFIGDPVNFSASTCNPSSAGLDSRLYLFAADGSGVIMNDDEPSGTCPDGTLLSELPLGDPNGPSTPGIYYLAISSWSNEALDAGANLIFNCGAFTDVCPPFDADPIASWDAGGTSDGPYQIDLSGDITPVELVSFTSTVDGTSINLEWATASETNNAGFEVQIQDGESWNVMGWVEGHGTSTEAQAYSFAADDMAVGTHTFRLKQIDFDGAFEYHGNLEVTVETPGTHVVSSAYPNPFNPQSQFTLAVAQEQHVTAELFNTLGQRVAVLFQGTVEANEAQLVTIDGAGLSSGMYIVRVNGERFNEALSVTLLK